MRKEPIIYKGKKLRQCSYAELKKLAVDLKIELRRLPSLNENHLIKAIKEHYEGAKKQPHTLFEVERVLNTDDDHVPFWLLRDKPMTFKVNYALHFGATYEEVKERLGITRKQWVDMKWHYDSHSNYKQKIIDYLNARKNG